VEIKLKVVIYLLRTVSLLKKALLPGISQCGDEEVEFGAWHWHWRVTKMIGTPPDTRSTRR